MVVAHTWWYTIFGLATLMVIQGVVPDLPDQTLVVRANDRDALGGRSGLFRDCRRRGSLRDPAGSSAAKQ